MLDLECSVLDGYSSILAAIEQIGADVRKVSTAVGGLML
jgi:hypothetical protein